jgi:kynurenine formamidase
VHGGAWRDPQLTSKSIEPTVAHAFSAFEASDAIMAIVSLNYSVSQYPSHPSHPYDVSEHSDPSREAVHPQHVSDVLHGLALLRSFGLQDESYILSGHSCGACIAFQTILQSPGYFGIENIGDAPAPAALIGLNGLYDLPDLVDGLGSSHEHLRREYEMLITNAFGPDKTTWPAASPTRFDPDVIGERISDGKVPRLVVIDQSNKDKLVPVYQKDRLIAQLSQVFEMHVVEGQRCDGTHAEPWEQGTIWLSALDAVGLLERQVSST